MQRDFKPQVVAAKTIRLAISDAFVMGGSQLLIGIPILVGAVIEGSTTALRMMATSSVIVIGPGVLYLVEARLLRRGDERAARMGFFGAISHLAGLILVFALANIPIRLR